MTVFFQLYGVSPELRQSGRIKLKFQGERAFSKEITKKLSAFPEKETDFIIHLPLKDFQSDYYQLEITLEDKKNTSLAKQRKRFMITPLPTISRPQTVSKTVSINKKAMISFILGSQYMQIKEYRKALPFLERAFHLNPRIRQFALGLSRNYFQLKKYDKIEAILAPFLNTEKPDYHLYLFLGNVNQKLKRYPAAVTYFKKILAYHGLSVDVLNRMASCYYFMGDKEEAKRAWKQSLKIDPNQEKVKKALRSL
jgi:tetratricopeptide (TPR) repeat protein